MRTLPVLAAPVPAAPLFAALCLATPAIAEGGAATAFVPMEEIAVPILDGARVEGVLRFRIVLRGHDPAAAATIARNAPRLRTVALIAALDFARLRASPYRAVDVGQLALSLDRALKAADPHVEQALIVEVGAWAQ